MAKILKEELQKMHKVVLQVKQILYKRIFTYRRKIVLFKIIFGWFDNLVIQLKFLYLKFDKEIYLKQNEPINMCILNDGPLDF